MRGPGTSGSGAPEFPGPGNRDVPEFDGTTLERLLTGEELPPGAPPALRPVADVLGALNSGPSAGELRGEAAALARFREAATRGAFRGAQAPGRGRRRTLAAATSRVSARLAGAAVVAALGLGGVATAAYAGSLPAPLQRFAHDTVGAPAPAGGRPAHSRYGSARVHARPGGSSPAAYGLCTAYARARAHGAVTQQAVDFRKLAAAAGGAGNVAAYCAAAIHPNASPRAGFPVPGTAGGSRASHPGSPGSSHAPGPGPSRSPSPRSSHGPSPRPSHGP